MFQSRGVVRSLVALASCLLLVLLLGAPVAAQDKPPVGTAGKMSPEEKAMMDAMVKAATPGKYHEIMASMVGDWDFKARMWMNPSEPPSESTGSATYRMLLGGRYLQGDYRGDMMGMPFEGRGLTAYDNVTGQYQASWVDNMSTMLMYMTGTYDPATKSITYLSEMPDMMNPGTKVKVREVVRMPSPDQHVMEMYEMRDGKENKTMEIVYTRRK